MTTNDKDRPFISHCIAVFLKFPSPGPLQKKYVQDLACPVSRNWEHPQSFCLRWKDIYTSNTALPERHLSRRPCSQPLHGLTRVPLKLQVLSEGKHGLEMQEALFRKIIRVFICFCHSYEWQNQAYKPPSQWASKPSFATHLRRCALWYVLDIGVGMLLHTSLDRDRQRNLEDSSGPGRGDLLLK